MNADVDMAVYGATSLTFGAGSAGASALRLLEDLELIMEAATITGGPGEAHGLAHARGGGRRPEFGALVSHSDCVDAHGLFTQERRQAVSGR